MYQKKRFIGFVILEAIPIYIIYFFVKYGMSYKRASDLGAFLGCLGSFLPIKRNRIVKKNIALAFPEKSTKEVLKIYRNSWTNFGRNILELVNLAGSDKYKEYVTEIKGFEALKSYRNQVLLTCHTGNWEILGLFANQLNCLIAMLPTKNFLINKLIFNLRVESENAKILPAGRTLFLAMLEQIKKPDHHIIFLADHKVYKGIEVEFFHQKAWTNTIPISIALKKDLALFFVRIIRNEDRYTFRIEFEKPIKLKRSDNYEQDLIKYTTLMSKKFESWIKEYPEQWFWLHNKWNLK